MVETAKQNAIRPILIDLGKKRKKQIKRLRKGEGKLMVEVVEALEELERDGTIGAGAQAVIVVVRERADSPWFSYR